MNILIALARFIDALNERIGRGAFWFVLATAVVSAVNALIRYGFGRSSNAWLEIQWYLFAAVFLLAAGYTLKHNGHVRIDIFYGRLSLRAQTWIDLAGSLLFLLPFSALMLWLSWPGFIESFHSGEMSPDAGGLIRWPVRLLMPLGFGLLMLQAIAEAIKCVAFLHGIDLRSHEKPVEEV